MPVATPSQLRLSRLMKKGATVGAISGGVLGFVLGISICIAYRLPIPPLGVTEFGILLGGSLGSLMNVALHDPIGRAVLRGLGAGALLGLPVALLPSGHFHPLSWMAVCTGSTFLSYQRSLLRTGAFVADWSLHRS